ncbi:MAG TPA: hypothetical protein VG225_11940 [Terracidiphilus sp.]|jgi:hypothetical protein|nr:hypothetical protein [Terracidiphilus sp.]
MGREAECACTWNGVTARVKALIEPPELILRGELRRRVPFAQMGEIRVDGEQLCFKFQGENVSLNLGSALAARWAKAFTAPPPSLAKKLGITAETVVRMIGTIDDNALSGALSGAKQISKRTGTLILARVNTPQELARALQSAAPRLALGTPIWFIYPKGKGHALTASDVRTTALATGIVDTKVAAVSSVLTALRFVKRR